MKLYNFHSHTKRCGHAHGEDEEYIVRAIEEGFDFYGVSDHVMFPTLNQPGIRGGFEKDFENYISSIRMLISKNQKQIDLHLGMEAEYYEAFHHYYVDLLKNDLEYLILGQHFYFVNSQMLESYSRHAYSARLYANDLMRGMKSGLFLYVAHPDLIAYCDILPPLIEAGASCSMTLTDQA